MRTMCMFVTCLSCVVAQSLTESTPLTGYDLKIMLYSMPKSYTELCPVEKYVLYQCSRRYIERHTAETRRHSIQILEMNYM
ncbi:unnamed protein product [Soboliphyme baturini]|uniref:Secreted protein n=1 Tax=Soboliphyme baturini TaxID=241478 RepID=A0A183I9K3_9BILA|nr:unnamed protein product [Soboliphyme baturini]